MEPSVHPTRVLKDRVRFIAGAILTLFLVGWVVWKYPFDDLLDRSGTPLGADYAMFYVGGQIVLDGDSQQLYDQAEHQQRLHQLFPGIDPHFALPYRYPPFVALLMAPLAALPYAASYAVFLAFSVAAWCVAIHLLCRDLRICNGDSRTTILLALAAWPVALETLIGGQGSMVAVLIVAATLFLLRRQQIVWAGVALALAAYKPNVLGLLGLACVIRYPRMLLGITPVATVILLLSSLLSTAVLGDYVELTMSLASASWDVETPHWKVHSLSGIVTAIAPGSGRSICILGGLAATSAIGLAWRRVDPADRAGEAALLALAVTVNALCNPYTPIYDLTLLAIGALLTIEHLYLCHRNDAQLHPAVAQLLLAGIYCGPHLSQAVALQTGLQLFPLFLIGIGIWQLRLSRGCFREPALLDRACGARTTA